MHRVEGAIEDSITITYNGFDATGISLAARFVKGTGGEYTRNAVVDDVGNPGLGEPARFTIPFMAGDLTVGDQKFDLSFTSPLAPDFALPREFKLTLRVREQ